MHMTNGLNLWRHLRCFWLLEIGVLQMPWLLEGDVCVFFRQYSAYATGLSSRRPVAETE